MVALESPSKPHSRAHGNSAHASCRESGCKSLDRIEIGLVIYESCVGLESCSRDPIGYGARRLNVYEYVGCKPLDFVDPSGLKLRVTGNNQERTNFLSQLNQLCPEAGLSVDGRGNVAVGSSDFCDDYEVTYCDGFTFASEFHPGKYRDSAHPKSCGCVCKAIADNSEIRINPRAVGGGNTNGRWPWEGGGIDVDIGPVNVLPLGRNGGRVSFPPFILLAHELCGHAVTRDHSGAGPIDVENEIREEHNIPDRRSGADHPGEILPSDVFNPRSWPRIYYDAFPPKVTW